MFMLNTLYKMREKMSIGIGEKISHKRGKVKKICENCKKRACFGDCKGFDRQKSVTHCALCGEVIRPEIGFYRMHGIPYCEDCLLVADTETILRICEIPRPIFWNLLGFAYDENNDLVKKEGL